MKLAVIHQPAHTSRRTKEEIRNSLTDTATKAAAQQPYEPPGLQTDQWSNLVLSTPKKICLTVSAEGIGSRRRYEVTKDSQRI